MFEKIWKDYIVYLPDLAESERWLIVKKTRLFWIHTFPPDRNLLKEITSPVPQPHRLTAMWSRTTNRFLWTGLKPRQTRQAIPRLLQTRPLRLCQALSKWQQERVARCSHKRDEGNINKSTPFHRSREFRSVLGRREASYPRYTFLVELYLWS